MSEPNLERSNLSALLGEISELEQKTRDQDWCIQQLQRQPTYTITRTDGNGNPIQITTSEHGEFYSPERVTEPDLHEASHTAGWNLAIEHWYSIMQRLNDELNRYCVAVSYMMGIAIAGFGTVPQTMLKDASGKIAEAVDRIQSDVRRLEYITQRTVDLHSLIQESDSIKDALKAMYSGEDPTGGQLRAIAATLNPTMQRNALIDRLALGPGVKPSDTIDRICARAKHYRDKGFTWPDCYDRVVSDLYAIKDPSPEILAEIECIETGSDPLQNLRRSFNRRYGKST